MGLTAVLFYDETVARCKQGDVQSFEKLYAQYSKAMYNTSLRIVNNTPDAEDVLQESFAAAFEQLYKFDYSSTFGAWIKKIVINRSITILRNRKMILIDIDTSPVEEIPETELADEEITILKAGLIRKAIGLLPDGYRTVISLFLIEGYDYEEIAEVLQISTSTVRTQYHRARKKLLYLLKQGGL